MIRQLSKVGIFLFLTLSSYIVQAMPEAMSQLKKHIQAKEYQQAFELADKLTYELAGDVEFDFLAGLAAFGTGKYQNAVFAFERVVLIDPASFYGHYYLGLSYQKVDNLHAALSEFDTILLSQASGMSLTNEQSNKTAKQREYVAELIEQKDGHFAHDVTLSYGYDSNINSGTSIDDITMSDGTIIPLFDSSKETSDTALLGRYHANYSHPFNQKQSVIVDLSLQQTLYSDHTEQRRALIDFNIRYKHKVSSEASWNAGVATTPFWFAGDKYRMQNTIFAGWEQELDRNSGFVVNTSYSDVDYDLYEYLNLERYQLNAYYRYTTSVQQLFIINAYQDNNKQGLKYNDKNALGFSYVIDYPIYEAFTGSLMLMYEQQKYDGLNTFNEYSDATLKYVTSRINYAGFPGHLLQLQVNYQESNVDSNLAAMKIYEYHRLEANLKWKYNF